MDEEYRLHECNPTTADCEGNFTGHGAAVTECVEDVFGNLWAGNDEYASRVNYCPFCGFKAKRGVQ